MSIEIEIKIKPDEFIKELNDAIKKGYIETWYLDADGDYTHTPEQWRNRAWFKIRSKRGNKIVFGIVASRNFRLTKVLYAVYHGRFAEMLLAHLDNHIVDISISSLLDKNLDYFDY